MTKLENKLTDYFYWLAFGGRGDLSRGHYFYMLFSLEFGFQKDLVSYRPSNPHQWLALLVDVLGHYQNFYLEGSSAKEDINDLLKQTYTDFSKKYLENLGLVSITKNTKEILTKYLTTKSSLCLELSKEELAELSVEEMRLVEIFEYLPELSKPTGEESEKGKNKVKKVEKHSIGRSVLKKVREVLNVAYEQAIKTWEVKHSKLSFIDLVAAIPSSGTMAIDIVNYVLSESLDECDFVVFYALATNGPKTGKGREWFATFPYLPSEEDVSNELQTDAANKVEQFELLTGKSKSLDRKEEALAHLGLSQVFPLAIAQLDNWLQCSERFKELHVNEPWFATVTAKLNNIKSYEAELRGNVASKVLESE